MARKRKVAAALRTTSSIAMWTTGAATPCTGLLAMLALLVVLAARVRPQRRRVPNVERAECFPNHTDREQQSESSGR
jgi:TRAP-type C4-dicarboxylate transport system permease small subunit